MVGLQSPLDNAFYAVLKKKGTQLDDYQPAILVSTRQRDGATEIRVKDNGTGIPEKLSTNFSSPFLLQNLPDNVPGWVFR